MEPDPWQIDGLAGGHPRLLLNCSRQAGKSTTVAVLSILETVGKAGTQVLLLSRSLRQSSLLFRRVVEFLQRVGAHFIQRRTAHELDLKNFSKIICLPCKEETIRGYSSVGLLIIDEAALVPDDLYRAVRPMLAVSDGRLVCLSTPRGKRGFFYDAWARGGTDWVRIEVPAERIPRIKSEFLERERRAMGEAAFRQEFCCSFEAVEGLVYPDFARCVTKGAPPPTGNWVGGIDFGLRNPFAAVWGVLDRDSVLWLFGEHYAREKPLSYHVQHLPKHVTWYGDPGGAREILELRCAGVVVRKGDNDREVGLAAVRSRLESGMLKVLEGCCRNLLAEAGLYRYDPDAGSEVPLKENDHAMDALRYLISRIDTRQMARIRKGMPPEEPPPPVPVPNPPPAPQSGGSPAVPLPPAPKPRKWLSIYNEQLWTRLE